MTMMFQVKVAALLDNLAAENKIEFLAEVQQGAQVVTGMDRVKV